MTSEQFSPASPQEWTIIQISDTHLMDQPNLEFANMNPEQSFHEVMQHIQHNFPEMDALV
ncbi:metallophosphatase, partial [Acinetobacter schindleri]